ncbi:MAG: cell wall-binding repeat-containing protein, partial [Atopobiaceae bacterium]|nr:cell wall-binding repeat-containing protein [Atopobiaceae bacterium]
MSSLITYYQMLQVKDVIQQQYNTVPLKTNKENIQRIIALLGKNDTVLLGFKKIGWGGHAILAYGHETGNYVWGGKAYQGCINICDPNQSAGYNKECNIYYNTKTYDWTIPYYSSVGISSTLGARFNYVGASVSEINQGGYLKNTANSNVGQYVARIDAYAISDSRSVSKVSGSGGKYVTKNTAPGDIIEDQSFVLGGESEGLAGYNLMDASSAYRVSQGSPDDMRLAIRYQDCMMEGGATKGKQVIFDPAGFVEVSGSKSDYVLAMTLEGQRPTSWTTMQVNGSGLSKVSLEKTGSGYIMKADGSLSNVTAKAHNKDVDATRSFSVDRPSVFMYEIDKTHIGINVDNDGDGTYETPINDVSLAPVSVADQIYIGKAISPKPTVKLGGKTLKEGADYTVSYDNNTKVGTATMTISGMGNYAGSKVVKFKIVAPASKWSRLAGAGVYDTMAAISGKLGASTTAVVATSADFKDLLAASALAGSHGAPMLITRKGELMAQTASELRRMGAKTVYVMGSAADIADSVVNQIKALPSRPNVVRVGSGSASAKAVAAAKAQRTRSKTVIIATQGFFADALSISPYSYVTKSAILYAEANKALSAETLSYIRSAGFARAIVVGGPVALPAKVEEQL